MQKNVRCPQCGKQYNFSDIQIKSVMEPIVFLEMHCSSHMPLLATVTMQKQSKPKIISETVNQDDVIDLYKFLKNFNGSFEELFQNKKK